jgi:hypothetical protein
MIELSEPLFWLIALLMVSGWGFVIYLAIRLERMERKRDFWRSEFNRLQHGIERERRFDMRPAAPCVWPEGSNVVPLAGKHQRGTVDVPFKGKIS